MYPPNDVLSGHQRVSRTPPGVLNGRSFGDTHTSIVRKSRKPLANKWLERVLRFDLLNVYSSNSVLCGHLGVSETPVGVRV